MGPVLPAAAARSISLLSLELQRSVQIPPTIDLTHLTPVYLALHIIGGHIGLPLLVATCIGAKSVWRHPTLVNFFATWIIYSVVSCLTIYSGEFHPSVQPKPSALCFAQSALLHGALPMCATATLVVVIQAWSMFHQPELGSPKWMCSLSLIAKLTAPYIALLIFTTITAVLQHQNPDYVDFPNGLYCSYYKEPFRRYGVTIYCTVIIVLILFIEIAIGIRYYYTWKQISTVFPLANRHTSPALVARLTMFNLYSILALGAGIAFVTDSGPRSWPYMIEAGMPLAVVVVFGSQKDFFLAWCFWKKKRKGDPEMRECTMRCQRLDSLTDLLRRTPSPSVVPTPSIVTNSPNNIEVLDV